MGIIICPKGSKKDALGGRVAEHAIQKAIARYLLHLELQGKLLYFAIPNGGARHIAVAAKMKAEGVRAGVPDLMILTNGIPRFLEVKTDRGDLSEKQKEWFAHLDGQGVDCALVRSITDVENVLKEWGILESRGR